MNLPHTNPPRQMDLLLPMLGLGRPCALRNKDQDFVYSDDVDPKNLLTWSGDSILGLSDDFLLQMEVVCQFWRGDRAWRDVLPGSGIPLLSLQSRIIPQPHGQRVCMEQKRYEEEEGQREKRERGLFSSHDMESSSEGPLFLPLVCPEAVH